MDVRTRDVELLLDRRVLDAPFLRYRREDGVALGFCTLLPGASHYIWFALIKKTEGLEIWGVMFCIPCPYQRSSAIATAHLVTGRSIVGA